MASTKTTTRTRLVRLKLAVLCFVLAFFSLLNLFMTVTPVAKSNAQIDAVLKNIDYVSPDERSALFSQLEEQQERNLSQKPSEPYGWLRLAWLRFEITKDRKTAFAALRMSDLVSPYEAPQLPERAANWHRFRDIETDAQKAYQDVLWQKAYGMARDATWKIAVRNDLVREAGESLKNTAPALSEEWKAREAAHSGQPPVSYSGSR